MSWEKQQLVSFEHQQAELAKWEKAELETEVLQLIENDEELGQPEFPAIDTAAFITAEAPRLLVILLKHYTLG